jgi:hypothetical protein
VSEYATLERLVRPKKVQYKLAQEQIMLAQATLKEQQDKMALLQKETDGLEEELHTSKTRKDDIAVEIEGIELKITRALALTSELHSEQMEWDKCEGQVGERLLTCPADVLLASVYLTYCAPVEDKHRAGILAATVNVVSALEGTHLSDAATPTAPDPAGADRLSEQPPPPPPVAILRLSHEWSVHQALSLFTHPFFGTEGSGAATPDSSARARVCGLERLAMLRIPTTADALGSLSALLFSEKPALLVDKYGAADAWTTAFFTSLHDGPAEHFTVEKTAVHAEDVLRKAQNVARLGGLLVLRMGMEDFGRPLPVVVRQILKQCKSSFGRRANAEVLASFNEGVQTSWEHSVHINTPQYHAHFTVRDTFHVVLLVDDEVLAQRHGRDHSAVPRHPEPAYPESTVPFHEVWSLVNPVVFSPGAAEFQEVMFYELCAKMSPALWTSFGTAAKQWITHERDFTRTHHEVTSLVGNSVLILDNEGMIASIARLTEQRRAIHASLQMAYVEKKRLLDQMQAYNSIAMRGGVMWAAMCVPTERSPSLRANLLNVVHLVTTATANIYGHKPGQLLPDKRWNDGVPAPPLLKKIAATLCQTFLQMVGWTVPVSAWPAFVLALLKEALVADRRTLREDFRSGSLDKTKVNEVDLELEWTLLVDAPLKHFSFSYHVETATVTAVRADLAATTLAVAADPEAKHASIKIQRVFRRRAERKNPAESPGEVGNHEPSAATEDGIDMSAIVVAEAAEASDKQTPLPSSQETQRGTPQGSSPRSITGSPSKSASRVSMLALSSQLTPTALLAPPQRNTLDLLRYRQNRCRQLDAVLLAQNGHPPPVLPAANARGGGASWGGSDVDGEGDSGGHANGESRKQAEENGDDDVDPDSDDDDDDDDVDYPDAHTLDKTLPPRWLVNGVLLQSGNLDEAKKVASQRWDMFQACKALLPSFFIYAVVIENRPSDGYSSLVFETGKLEEFDEWLNGEYHGHSVLPPTLRRQDLQSDSDYSRNHPVEPAYFGGGGGGDPATLLRLCEGADLVEDVGFARLLLVKIFHPDKLVDAAKTLANGLLGIECMDWPGQQMEIATELAGPNTPLVCFEDDASPWGSDWGELITSFAANADSIYASSSIDVQHVSVSSVDLSVLRKNVIDAVTKGGWLVLYNSQWGSEGDLGEVAELVNGIIDSTVVHPAKTQTDRAPSPKHRAPMPPPSPTHGNNSATVPSSTGDGGQSRPESPRSRASSPKAKVPGSPLGLIGSLDQLDGEVVVAGHQKDHRRAVDGIGAGAAAMYATISSVAVTPPRERVKPRLHPSFRLWFIVSGTTASPQRHRIPRSLWNHCIKLQWQSCMSRDIYPKSCMVHAVNQLCDANWADTTLSMDGEASRVWLCALAGIVQFHALVATWPSQDVFFDASRQICGHSSAHDFHRLFAALDFGMLREAVVFACQRFARNIDDQRASQNDEDVTPGIIDIEALPWNAVKHYVVQHVYARLIADRHHGDALLSNYISNLADHFISSRVLVENVSYDKAGNLCTSRILSFTKAATVGGVADMWPKADCNKHAIAAIASGAGEESGYFMLDKSAQYKPEHESLRLLRLLVTHSMTKGGELDDDSKAKIRSNAKRILLLWSHNLHADLNNGHSPAFMNFEKNCGGGRPLHNASANADPNSLAGGAVGDISEATVWKERRHNKSGLENKTWRRQLDVWARGNRATMIVSTLSATLMQDYEHCQLVDIMAVKEVPCAPVLNVGILQTNSAAWFHETVRVLETCILLQKTFAGVGVDVQRASHKFHVPSPPPPSAASEKTIDYEAMAAASGITEAPQRPSMLANNAQKKGRAAPPLKTEATPRRLTMREKRASLSREENMGMASLEKKLEKQNGDPVLGLALLGALQGELLQFSALVRHVRDDVHAAVWEVVGQFLHLLEIMREQDEDRSQFDLHALLREQNVERHDAGGEPTAAVAATDRPSASSLLSSLECEKLLELILAIKLEEPHVESESDSSRYDPHGRATPADNVLTEAVAALVELVQNGPKAQGSTPRPQRRGSVNVCTAVQGFNEVAVGHKAAGLNAMSVSHVLAATKWRCGGDRQDVMHHLLRGCVPHAWAKQSPAQWSQPGGVFDSLRRDIWENSRAQPVRDWLEMVVQSSRMLVQWCDASLAETSAREMMQRIFEAHPVNLGSLFRPMSFLTALEAYQRTKEDTVSAELLHDASNVVLNVGGHTRFTLTWAKDDDLPGDMGLFTMDGFYLHGARLNNDKVVEKVRPDDAVWFKLPPLRCIDVAFQTSDDDDDHTATASRLYEEYGIPKPGKLTCPLFIGSQSLSSGGLQSSSIRARNFVAFPMPSDADTEDAWVTRNCVQLAISPYMRISSV